MSSNLLSSENSIPWIRIVLGLIVAGILPFFISNYHVFQASMVLSYAIALVGMNIPYWMTIPIAAFICLVVGFLFGLPALRLEGHYLALATFALAVALPQLLKFKHLEFLTGGVQGIVIMKPDPPWESLFGLKLNSDRWLYFFTLAVTLLMFVIGWNLIRGRVGRALIAIRDQPIAAASMGINTPMYKSLAFGVSAMFTGVAGALSAILVAFVAPDSFTVFLSITLLVGMVIGGVTSLTGALYGALFIQFIPNIADQISKAAPWAIYGTMLILFMYLMPTGIAGAIRLLGEKLRISRF